MTRLAKQRGVIASATALFVIMLFAYAAGGRSERRAKSPTTSHLNPPAQNEIVQPVRTERTAPACDTALRDATVRYQSVPTAAASGIAWPLVLIGPVAGVTVHGTGKVDAETNYLDCRLAETLVRWAPMLRAKGVIGLEHYSMYRPEAVVGHSDKPSGHATGLAIDVAKFELSDGRVLSVLDDWTNRARDGDPCKTWPDAPAGKLMRELVCDAAARGLFQTIVTPHHNDAHGNHVHLEVALHDSALWIH
jgi:hypothetical protein